MKCTGYVARDESATSADGFLVEVIAKESVRSTHASNDRSGQNRLVFLPYRDSLKL